MFNFPSSPTNGQTYQESAGKPFYTFDGEKWGVGSASAAYPDAPANGSTFGRRNNAWNAALPLTGGTISGALVIGVPKSADAIQFHDTTSNTNTTIRPGTTNGGIEFVNNAYSLVSASLDDSGNLLVMNNGVQAMGNKTGMSGIYYDAPNSNIGVRGNGGVYLQNAAAGTYAIFNSTGGTVYGALTSTGKGTLNGGLVTYSNVNIQDGGSSVEVQAAGGQACITFHNPAAFACNFGMSGGNFYMGGYSHGAVAYQFWTSKDFAIPTAPNLAPYVTNGRLAFAGDAGLPYDGTNWEPYGGAVCTGCRGAAPTGYYVVQAFRMRYMQLLTTSWFTIGYA